MVRACLLLLCLALSMASALAEEAPKPLAPEDGWRRSADLTLSLAQTSYNNAWSGTESGTVTWAFTGNMAAERALSRTANWRNTLLLAYGMTHTQAKDEAGDRHWLSPVKSSDRIFFESLMRLLLGAVVDPYAALTAETQAYNPFEDAATGRQVDRTLDPLTISEAVGVGRTLLKDEQGELLSRVGLALRQTISRTVLSVEPEETETATTTDGGVEWVTDYAQVFGGGSLKYVSKLRVFQALFNSESDELEGLENEDDWKSPDVAWENTLSASVTRYVQVSLFGELRYDREIDPRGRFREILGLGLTYKLF